jgi:hypothetical protein
VGLATCSLLALLTFTETESVRIPTKSMHVLRKGCRLLFTQDQVARWRSASGSGGEVEESVNELRHLGRIRHQHSRPLADLMLLVDLQLEEEREEVTI